LPTGGARGDLDARAKPVSDPGYKFHALKGDRKGEFAVSISGNWRITFEFDGQDAMNVCLEDYH
jgi:proteic killer suppression protein